jgi:uncharacterized ParB-like nuclease family protein
VNTPRILSLTLAKVRADPAVQARVRMDVETVEDYAEVLAEGGELPPVVVFHEPAAGVYWLADGFHRLAAHEQAGRKHIYCDVRDGDRRAAVLHACGANAANGLRRTRADKRRAITLLLADEEWACWSNLEIGRRCGTSGQLVGWVREELAGRKGGEVNRVRRVRSVRADGRVLEYEIDAAKCNPRAKSRAAAVQQPAAERSAVVAEVRGLIEQAQKKVATLGQSAAAVADALALALAELGTV